MKRLMELSLLLAIAGCGLSLGLTRPSTTLYSAATQVEGFWRYDLKAGGSWEPLPPSRPVQGLGMVAHDGSIYRIGGLVAKNATLKEEADLHSLDEFERFDPTVGRWEKLTPMPVARSSHDAAVWGDHVYVVGGWRMRGKGNDEEDWHDSAYRADLTQRPIVWEKLPTAPFKRRALAVAAAHGRIYAIGGMTHQHKISNSVDYYDVETGKWVEAPALPVSSKLKGFGATAFGHGGAIYASPCDGEIYKLTRDAKQWERTGYRASEPRFFHRLIPAGNRLYLLGGAAFGQGHTHSVEAIDLSQPAPPITGPPPSHDPHGRSPRSTKNKQVAEAWPGFRGKGDSHASASGLPLQWSDDEGVAWRKKLEGYGQSSPVVWGDRVFVTSVQGAEKETLIVSALSVKTGKTLWSKRFDADQKIKSSQMVSRAAPTPVVDAKRLYVFFESGNLMAMGHDGEVVWQRGLSKAYGAFQGNHGIGSSPALTADGGLAVLVDHGGPSYLLCVDAGTGKTRWKADHPQRVSWSSPVYASGEIIVSSNGFVESHDAVSGKKRWSVDGLEKNTVPSPTLTDDLVIVGTSDRAHSVAIRRRGAQAGRIAWRAEDASTTFCSPLAAGQSVYYVNRAGVVHSVDMKTGKKRWDQRIASSCWASPVLAGDRVYFFGKDGSTTVMQADTAEPKILAESKLTLTDETRLYGVAAVDGAWLIRTGDELICVGKPALH